MALQYAFLKKIMISGFDRELSYGVGPGGWTSASAFELIDYPDASGYEQWDDTVVANNDLVTGYELATDQIIARQSMRIAYAEPRSKPNTLATMLGLILGNVVSTQDGVVDAWRHRIQPATDPRILPSVGIQTMRENGVQRKYHGVKGNEFTLTWDGSPFLGTSGSLIGSGHRATAADAFPGAISEDWILWGNANLYIKDTGGTPIDTTLATPSQTAANLGGSEVNISTRVRQFSLSVNNNLSADDGYRASTGLLRTNFHPSRRVFTLSFTLDADTATEAADLNYYLQQAQLAFELRVNSGVLIDAGVFNYGATLIIPRLQLQQITRGQTNQIETLTINATVMDDKTNPFLLGLIYNAQAAYLA